MLTPKYNSLPSGKMHMHKKQKETKEANVQYNFSCSASPGLQHVKHILCCWVTHPAPQFLLWVKWNGEMWNNDHACRDFLIQKKCSIWMWYWERKEDKSQTKIFGNLYSRTPRDVSKHWVAVNLHMENIEHDSH